MGHLSLTLTGINSKEFLIYKNASLIIRLAFFMEINGSYFSGNLALTQFWVRMVLISKGFEPKPNLRIANKLD